MMPLEYARRGWCVVPIPCGQKKPAITSWQNFSAAIEDIPRLFGNGENVAVRLGPRSGDLVDVDLDCPEALELADLYLPRTHAEFGRLSKPTSHRLYGAPGAVFETFAGPVAGEMLLELRTDGREGGRTFPCSRHRSQTGSGENGTVISSRRRRSTPGRCGLSWPNLRSVASPCATSANTPPDSRAQTCRSYCGSSITTSAAQHTGGSASLLPMRLGVIRDQETS
jgi:Bifunctional DNA primase/polymerase, N-terminal